MQTEQFQMVNGRNICYVRAGHGPNKLLCIPGLLGSWNHFTLQLRHLDHSKFTIIAVDPPGYGKSVPFGRKPIPHNFIEDAHIMNALMEKLALTPYSVFGWSDGGMTAIFLAHQQRTNDTVKRLVLLATNCTICPHVLDSYAKLEAEIQSGEVVDDTGIGDWCSDEYALEVVHGDLITMKRFFAEDSGEICGRLLKDIPHPSLVVHGATDHGVPLAHARFTHEHLPNSKGLIIHPTGGHELAATHSEWFNEKMTAFLVDEIQPEDAKKRQTRDKTATYED